MLGSFLRGALIATILISLVDTVSIMVRYHPFQNVYFNRLAGENMTAADKNYSMDYWALAHKKGFEFILKHDPSSHISIFSEGAGNALLFSEEERKRLELLSRWPWDAKYYITHYQWFNLPRWKDLDLSNKPEVYSIKIDGAKIMGVYRMDTVFPNAARNPKEKNDA